MDFVNIAGLQFRRAGKIYDFNIDGFALTVGDEVVVDTERGPSVAKVASLKYVSKEKYPSDGLKGIMRVATERDLSPSSRFSPEDVERITKEKIARAGLEMKILKAEIQLGGNKITVFFSAPGRVDFRDLVKDLAGTFKARVELKQVGARDEAKLVGGVGICGREYCCSSFLRDFVPVSIKMAKNQNLALNPSKVSGGCGRLLCCLTYENDTYSDLRRRMPSIGSRVRTADGQTGDIIKGDLLNQLVLVETDQGQQVPFKISEIEVIEKSKGAAAEEGEWGQDIDLAALKDISDD